LFSETRDAATFSQVIIPEQRPPEPTKNAGSPTFLTGFVNLFILWELKLPISWTYNPRVSSYLAGYSPWKLPPDIIYGSSVNTRGLSLPLFISISSISLELIMASSVGPWI